MATTKPFAEVLLDTPMERASMVAHLDAYEARMMRREEQEDPNFFNNDLAPRSRASSQSSSRSRGGLAPQSGVQARLDLFPKRVTRWLDFHDEVGWDTFREEAIFGDVRVLVSEFRTNNRRVHLINENDAWDRMNSKFMDRVMSEVLIRYADTAPNGWTPFDINGTREATGVGHRVDYVWSRDMDNGADRSRAGILTPQDPNRARFLVHEHKSPAKFPYGMTQDDLEDLAQTLMQDTSYSLDEAKEVANSAWEMACDDLVDYWELGEGFPDRERSVRFRYPIIQIYVYMLRSFCKYGVLSTTDRTWFLKIDNDNVLHISGSFLSTATGRGSMRHAYVCMLRRNLVSTARLTLDEEHLRAICQTDIRIGNPEWADVWRRFGYHVGAGAAARGGHRGPAPPGVQTDTASLGDREALRELLPLKSDLSFPYAGGLLDVIEQYPEGQYGFTIRVDTGGVDTVVKVMTPAKTREETHVAESAFWHEMDVYCELRSLWGTHVPWYLYGGRHIFNDLIVATTYAGKSLDSNTVSEDIREKAWAALMAVHAVRVAHRDVLLRNFVMDDAGTVRIIDFAQAKTDASIRELEKDCEDFDRVFSRALSRGRPKT